MAANLPKRVGEFFGSVRDYLPRGVELPVTDDLMALARDLIERFGAESNEMSDADGEEADVGRERVMKAMGVVAYLEGANVNQVPKKVVGRVEKVSPWPWVAGKFDEWRDDVAAGVAGLIENDARPKSGGSDEPASRNRGEEIKEFSYPVEVLSHLTVVGRLDYGFAATLAVLFKLLSPTKPMDEGARERLEKDLDRARKDLLKHLNAVDRQSSGGFPKILSFVSSSNNDTLLIPVSEHEKDECGQREGEESQTEPPEETLKLAKEIMSLFGTSRRR